MDALGKYLRTSYRPDRDFVDGRILERNVGLMRHAYALTLVGSFISQSEIVGFMNLRVRVSPTRVRIIDLVAVDGAFPEEDALSVPPYLCIEIVSPEDTFSGMQDRIDDYLAFGVPNIWVSDPWKHRAWTVTETGWARVMDGVIRTPDGRVAMPLADVFLP